MERALMRLDVRRTYDHHDHASHRACACTCLGVYTLNSDELLLTKLITTRHAAQANFESYRQGQSEGEEEAGMGMRGIYTSGALTCNGSTTLQDHMRHVSQQTHGSTTRAYKGANQIGTLEIRATPCECS